jgi:hypothetical protein
MADKSRGDSTADPLADGHVALARRGWVFDFDEDWGGFAAGELLLRSDGCLFTRASGAGDRMSEWTRKDGWAGGTDVEACFAWMRERGYDLHEPIPVPVDQSEAGRARH